MQVSLSCNTNKNGVCFSGITKAMSHKVFIDGKKDVLNYLAHRTSKNTNVGTLPPCIFDKIKDLKTKAVAIKEIYKVFEECANEIRRFSPSINGPADEYKNRRPNSCVDKMRAVLTKYNILENPKEFDLVYLDKGEYKGAYKMQGLKEEKTGDVPCYKVFHKVDDTPEWHKYKCHGNYAELNSAIYWRKAEGNYSDINRLYCGDMKSGYLIDRYIDDTTPPPQKITCMYDHGAKNTDVFQGGNGHNIKNSYLFDQGGYRVINRVKNSSKVACYVLKHLKETPEKYRWHEWNKLLSSKVYNNLDDTQKKAGLALAIKHLNPEEQILATDMCLKFNKPLVDMAIGYALKYMPTSKALEYFPVLMKKNNVKVQTVLLNEIPLLSRLSDIKFDDINTPRQIVDPQKVNKFYQIAKPFVLDGAREHLASYVHLLPKDIIQKEADELISYNTHEINDRFLHKIKYEPTTPEGFCYSDKMEIISKIEKATDESFIKEKAAMVRRKVINE